MTSPHLCPTCGQMHQPKPERLAWRTLTANHARILYKLLLAVRHYGRNRIHIRREMADCEGAPFQLTKDEWTNFGYLRYFGLAVHADPEKTRGGHWVLTRRGAQFLRGEIPLPKRVRVERGHPVEYSDERVYLRDLRVDEWYSEIPQFDPERPEHTGLQESTQATLTLGGVGLGRNS